MSVTFSASQLESLKATLLNTSGSTPLHERFRALFTLKAAGGKDVVEIIAAGFADESPLLKHELAYVLGQIGDHSAVPHLETVLRDENKFHGEMVRHESAEALGALSSQSSLPLLRSYLSDPSRPVRETCEIAVDKIEWDHSEEGKARVLNANFPTIDPAPAKATLETESVPELRAIMLDTKRPLFERYRAMFGLRNIGGKDGVEALAAGFSDESALFRHEVAYIFGQLSSVWSIPSLLHVLRDQQEDEMVRHEAAEALGGIASEGEGEDQVELSAEDKEKGVLGILREWCVKEDAPSVVRESCQVAIDMWEYENSPDQFQPMKFDDDEPAAGKLTGMERSAAMAVANAVKA